MKRITSLAASTLAGIAVFGASPATAQSSAMPDDLDPAAVAAATRYALPLMFDGYMTRCMNTLESDGFAITHADHLRSKFSDGAEAAWPGARELIIEMGREEAGDMAAVFEVLDDDALRPLVDGLVTNLIATEVKEKDCASIERGLEILDPLPADNLAMMVGFIVQLVQEDRKAEQAEAAAEHGISDSHRRKLREQERGQ